ncbi:MAG TPA: membrane protein insertion efficiency factor YidD [Burkholderiaceae bacterium]|nr:membrane protein insertion efficiency factor YidD [Burkholderiaceae bacterium]HNB47140.1 membrane protein insertion efficiency factor YidD [Burkholderiaceae bacterium]HNG80701.1 membrane protein insertion efficiency factor YidD [Burkholderiaceae bacterium]
MPQRLLIGLVRGYRLLLSPWLGSACRFEPTCSVYALGALDGHGALRGSVLTVARIGRCHPWCRGGHDPVPKPGTGLFTALLGRPRTSATTDGVALPASDFPDSPRKTSSV